jgi:hypothetical protein
MMCLIFIEPLFTHRKNYVFNHCNLYAPEVSSEPPILCSTSCHAFLQRPSLALPTTTTKKEKKIDKLSHQQIQFHFSSCTSQTLGSTMVATQSPQLGCCGTEPLRCTYYRSHFSLPNRIRIHRGTNRVFAVATEPKPNRTGGSSNSAKSPPLKAVNGVSTVNLLV